MAPDVRGRGLGPGDGVCASARHLLSSTPASRQKNSCQISISFSCARLSGLYTSTTPSASRMMAGQHISYLAHSARAHVSEGVT